MSKPTVHVDFGPWEVESFEDRADVGQLPHDAACSCGISLREHFDRYGKWITCALAFRPKPAEKTRTVPQWGGIAGL